MLNTGQAGNTTLADIVTLALGLDTGSDEVRDGFPCIYSRLDPETLEGTLECMLERYPVVVDDREVYPEPVVEGGHGLIYYGQQFIDVIDAARSQLDGESVEPFIQALNHYRDNDDFMDF
ncbi:hypothetical protein [Clavibacter sp. CT19]|nr:hypothetical protein [Clavibacter sp. CT19]MDA3804472.1 hypothetical protein [Clavibacter sp. CT19]